MKLLIFFDFLDLMMLLIKLFIQIELQLHDRLNYLLIAIRNW